MHLDVSRLEQWEIVFSHAQTRGLFLHFKTQEAENQGLLDGGETGPQRKLYYRELIARFGHHLALNWNMGEEIGPWQEKPPMPPQLTPQRLAMAEYFYQHDPYHHHVVIHNGMKFDDILGPKAQYTGSYTVQWFDPRNGGSLVDGTVRKVNAGSSVSIGPAPNPTSSDWVALVTRVGFEAE